MSSTLQMISSFSIASIEGLVNAKQRIYREFEENLLNTYPQRLLAIVDGTVFRLEREEDYDRFVEKLDNYFVRRNPQGKIITVNLFSA